jgi:hypothetical protein
MNDVALATPNLPTASADTQAFELQLRKAKVFAASTLVPQQYRNNLPDCVIAMNMANRIGADVLQVMQNLYIVQGKPGWSAQFLIATFNQSGRFSAMRFEWQGHQGGKDWGCRAYATEKATGETIRGAWVTWKMAEAEGWTKKNGSKWLSMPEMMMTYRAAAFLVRTYAPEIAMGLQTTEEIIDVTPPAGVVSLDQHGSKADAIANALRSRQAEAPAVIDTDTGEVTPTHLTYAVVRNELENAKSSDDFALAVDMIRSVADEGQRKELTELAKLLQDNPGE